MGLLSSCRAVHLTQYRAPTVANRCPRGVRRRQATRDEEPARRHPRRHAQGVAWGVAARWVAAPVARRVPCAGCLRTVCASVEANSSTPGRGHGGGCSAVRQRERWVWVRGPSRRPAVDAIRPKCHGQLPTDAKVHCHLPTGELPVPFSRLAFGDPATTLRAEMIAPACRRDLMETRSSAWRARACCGRGPVSPKGRWSGRASSSDGRRLRFTKTRGLSASAAP